ncbi:hypothetical protein [Thioalkalivibrio sp. HK1]|uniref:hypothetical protein n=1 Tax=Thioalkalivibrio sp. HK1 TaxID=1469245 RepID=UPI00046E562C|nr:hypothetical protein [Thioalkalivibrio sp. HK1]
MNIFNDESTTNQRRINDGRWESTAFARWFGGLFDSTRGGFALAFAGSVLSMTSAAFALDFPPSTTASGGPVGPGFVMGAQVLERGDSTLRFYCNEHATSCTISMECATYDGENQFEGTFAPMPARQGRTVEIEELMEVISWDRTAGITCRVYSRQDATVQQLERTSDGRLSLISGWSESEERGILDISGVQTGHYQSAVIHSIKSPAMTSPTEFTRVTIFCKAPEGEDCGCSPTTDPSCEVEDQVWVSCSDDDGAVHEVPIGMLPRHSRAFLDEVVIASIIDHRWEGRGLSCEVRSDQPINLGMSDVIDGATFANQSAVSPKMPADDTPSSVDPATDPFSLPIRAYAYAISSSESRDQASLLMYCNDDHHHCPAWLECTTQSGEVLGDRAASATGDSQRNDRFYRRAHLEIPPRGVRRMSAAEIEERITKTSWAGMGRLTCAIRSDKDIRAQVWMRSGDNPQVNNTAYIRSEEMEGIGDDMGVSTHVARVHSVPAPSAIDVSNIRIHCTAATGQRCGGSGDRLRIRCSEDDGTMREGTLDPIAAGSIRHINSVELAEIIGSRWEGIGLACEVLSDQPFNVQILTRTGDEGLLLDGGRSVRAAAPSR